jgi:hypothetical protein
MTDISNYEKTRVGTDLCLDFCDMAAKYTVQPIIIGKDRSVKVELFIHDSNQAAVTWEEFHNYQNQSIDRGTWNPITFLGYPASKKSITHLVSDNQEAEVFIRVAVGNVGIQSTLTQKVSKYSELTPQEELEAIVDEVTEAVIHSLGG